MAERAKAALQVKEGTGGAPGQAGVPAGDWLVDAAAEGGAAALLPGKILARRVGGMGRMATEGGNGVAGRNPEPCSDAMASDTTSLRDSAILSCWPGAFGGEVEGFLGLFSSPTLQPDKVTESALPG